MNGARIASGGLTQLDVAWNAAGSRALDANRASSVTVSRANVAPWRQRVFAPRISVANRGV